MTDVTVAPASAPTATPQPASSNEVAVNQNPTTSPNPIGSQAPPAPPGELKGSEHRTPSRSETARAAIEAAFDRANKPLPKSARDTDRQEPKAAEAKKGHNQPPEDVPNEKLDLKKRPSDQPQAQPRGERGQFAPRTQNNATEAQNNATEAQNSANGAQNSATAQTGNFRDPPPRMAEHAKRDWAQAPESVRAEVYRMHQEFGKAYQSYRGAAEAFQPIAHFHQMAQQHGTTLQKALHNYVSIEQKLRTDPIAGLDTIIHNLGLTDPQTGQKLGLRDIAYSVLSQSPEQLKLLQQGNQQTAASQQIGALHQEINGLKSHLMQMHNQQRFSYTRSAVDQFADAHPRFDELGDLIEQELKAGYNLDAAYRRAELLRPATQAAQTRTTPSAQTRTPDRSIHGNPDVAPSNGASRKPKEASASPRDAVRNAISRMNGHA